VRYAIKPDLYTVISSLQVTVKVGMQEQGMECRKQEIKSRKYNKGARFWPYHIQYQCRYSSHW